MSLRLEKNSHRETTTINSYQQEPVKTFELTASKLNEGGAGILQAGANVTVTPPNTFLAGCTTHFAFEVKNTFGNISSGRLDFLEEHLSWTVEKTKYVIKIPHKEISMSRVTARWSCVVFTYPL